MVKLLPRPPAGPWLRVPAGFDAAESLPPDRRHRADDAAWLLHTILDKVDRRKLDGGGYARLHSDVLRRFMRDEPAVVRDLVTAGDIEKPAPTRRAPVHGIPPGREASRRTEVGAGDRSRVHAAVPAGTNAAMRGGQATLVADRLPPGGDAARKLDYH